MFVFTKTHAHTHRTQHLTVMLQIKIYTYGTKGKTSHLFFTKSSFQQFSSIVIAGKSSVQMDELKSGFI